jgi:hypothetical protein
MEKYGSGMEKFGFGKNIPDPQHCVEPYRSLSSRVVVGLLKVGGGGGYLWIAFHLRMRQGAF